MWDTREDKINNAAHFLFGVCESYASQPKTKQVEDHIIKTIRENLNELSLFFTQELQKEVKDIDKLVKNIEKEILLDTCIQTKSKQIHAWTFNNIKQLLTPYIQPQKKLTREEICLMFPDYEWSKIDWALELAKNMWLLKD